MEKVKQKLKLTVEIPEDHVVIQKEEYERLQDLHLKGKFINLKELADHTSRSTQWIKKNILYHPKYQKELVDIVYYPKGSGDTFVIKAKEMFEFLDQEFMNILRG